MLSTRKVPSCIPAARWAPFGENATERTGWGVEHWSSMERSDWFHSLGVSQLYYYVLFTMCTGVYSFVDNIVYALIN